jgi:IS4 transposase
MGKPVPGTRRQRSINRHPDDRLHARQSASLGGERKRGEQKQAVGRRRSNRKQPYSFSKRLYKLRWRIESAFNRLKDFRRIATRYDRLARNYLASVCLAAALVWWI